MHLGGGLGAADNSLFLFKAGFSPLRHRFCTLRIVAAEDRYGPCRTPPRAPSTSMGSSGLSAPSQRRRRARVRPTHLNAPATNRIDAGWFTTQVRAR